MLDPVIRAVLVLFLILTATCDASAAPAEDAKTTWTVGVLANAANMEEPILDAFRQRLRELGYVEGKNLRIEFRTARSEVSRLPKTC